MRIAIPYEDGVVCQHFGKAPQFKIFDVQPQGVVESVVIDSEASGHEALAEFLAAQGVQAVICGGIGQGALVSLAQSGIDVLPGVTGNPDEVIEALIAGTLQPEGTGGCGCGCGGMKNMLAAADAAATVMKNTRVAADAAVMVMKNTAEAVDAAVTK
jgi:predicted Fe-Mo cluster-binding NifX family protein